MGQSIEKKEESKPRLIVLPLQPKEGQAYDGIGLGVHFLLGNVVALHTGLKEFWFGWRVKKIFLKKEKLRAYCRGEGPPLDIAKLGKEQDIRYWLGGSVQQQGSTIQIALVLTDTNGEREEWATELILDPADQLIGFRKGFLAWLDACGLPFPDAQVANALWPEKTTLKSLELLGRDLEAYYLHSSWGDKGPFDPELFDSAVSAAPSSYLAHDLKGWVLYKNKDYKSAEKSFRSAIKMNSVGLGAISGLMWCAVYTNDEENAYKWAMAKADIRGESREAAKASVARRIKKYSK
ncbi:MAG: hypothetical protein JSV50_19805 [Desulfobacteraceae bacterium]|nr:MAG: hypothetical protein JSV50_19805 [Desulfobacteraceae bacterium]